MPKENLEEKIQKESGLKTSFFDGVKAIPAIAGCTFFAYLLNFPGCGGSQIAEFLPYNAAAGTGFYGGSTIKKAGRLVSFLALGGTLVPEFIAFASQNDRLDYIGIAAGIKLMTYGFGYGLGMLLRQSKNNA